MATDPKAKWFSARIAEGFSLESELAQDLIEKADCTKLFIEFFSATGPQKALFFYDGERLRYSTDDTTVYPGRILFFVRPVKRNVQIANAETEFTWASTTADALPSLQTLLSDVYIPLFERSPTWGKVTNRAIIDGYLTNIRKYVSTLKEAQIVLSERFDFKIPNDPVLNKIPVDPYLIQKTIADNPDLILTAERALAEVSNQVELFLAESTRVRVDDDSSGPESEIVYWRARMASFSAVHQRVHSISWLQSCVTLLQNTQSPVMQRWVRIKQRVLEGVTEAKDNLRYLYTIEEILEPIYNAEPAKIAETVPHLMATVKIVHQMARYYSTTENMTTLLVKISNQMIRACREYLRTDSTSLLIPRPGMEIAQPATAAGDAQGDDDDPAVEVIASLNKKRPSSDSLENAPTIYDRQPEDILKRIDECIQLCVRYQQEYHNIRRQMQQENCEKQFNFAESGIFGNFDLFCTRLKKIADIIITNENFSSLQQSTLQNLHPILDQSEKLILSLRKKNYDPINHRLTQFDTDHTEYMQGISKLEDSISSYVNAICDDENNTVNDIISLLQQLHVILNRPTMKTLIMDKYEFLLNKYIDEINRVKTYFDENKDNPKIPIGWSPTAGRLAWVRLIMRRLTTVYEFFRRVQIHVEDENDPAIQRSASFENLLQATTHVDEYLPLLSFYKAGRRAYKMYMKLVKQLFDYETTYHDMWVESITGLRASLQATLLVEHPQTGKLYVNFDRKIVLLCREVHYLRQLRIEIPETALAITMHEKSLLHYRDSLQDLLEAIENIKQSINPAVAELVKPLISKLNKKVQPGLKTLCWTSMSIGGYLDNIQKQVTTVKEVLKIVDDIISLRIATNLKAISTTCLLPLFKRYAFGDPHNDPSQGGTVTVNNVPGSTPDDDNEDNAAYTNHKMRLYSAYLEHNTQALPYKQYLEQVRPHIRQAAESIYSRSQLIAIAVIDVIIAITSRYISSSDSENATMLSEIVTSAIHGCFMPHDDITGNFASYTSRRIQQSDSIVGTTMAESGEQVGTLEGSKDDIQRSNRPASGADAAAVIKSAIKTFVDKFHDNTITAVFLCTERTLRAIYQRVTMYLDPHLSPKMDKLQSYYVPDAMILCDFELALPSTRLSPSWDDLRKGYIDTISLVLQVSKRLPKWNAGGDYMANVLTTIRPIISRQDPDFVAAQLTQTLTANAATFAETRSFTSAETAKSAKAAFERSSRSTSRAGTGSRNGDKKPGNISARMTTLSSSDGKLIYDRAEFLPPAESFYSMVGKSRTLLKLLVALQGAFGMIIKKTNAYLSVFDTFQSLWLDDKNETYKKFIDKRPELSDFLSEIVRFENTIHNISLIPTMVQQGICVFSTEALKNSLQSEAAVWKGLFSSNLNKRARLELSTMRNYITELQTTISKKINDLDDVRQIMAALEKLRELQAVFELKIQPIEEMYERLESHGIKITAEEAEDLSGLRHMLKTLQTISSERENELKREGPNLKKDLEDGIAEFKVEVKKFKENWDTDGPNVPGITPQRAVQQLKLFQTQFSDIERKWITYQSGEETFGLEITNYPELIQIKKDLKMLSSLYNLYTDVLSTIDGYSDQLWTDLNFDDIQVLMSDYQQRCLRLPKGMREWEAYIELQAKIEDFGTLLPLFQLMSHPAVKQRHWLEISKVTDKPSLLRVIEDPDNFRLKDLLEAPLLKYAEDLEDICSAATKETEIEEKLGVIRSQWQEQTFTFQEFKTRGLLNLAPSETSELIVMLEDSQMLLSSLVSNRFNKPFKDELSQWVKRLSTLDEILILWLQVQQNWIYLEAVFSGGDISRQLPAEAKRFSQIDKSWIKIMTTAVTTPNCIHLTSVDDTLKSLLPYLIEQLELCQKSLSGYLEQKRNLFARFYFVSDPVLLEILGQQSDPSSIQPHLLSIFDSIYMLDFDRVKRSNVVAINDRSGEKVQLSTIVEAKGSVEDWLNELIKVMQRSLKDIIRNAAADLTKPDVSVQEIFETYPAQVTLLAIQLLWTMWIEAGLRQARQDKKIMQVTLKKVNNLLQTLVSITLQDLNKRQRTNVETLVTIHVHQRDVSEELTNNKIKSPTDFEWLRQTRFYWSTDTDNCKIQITDIDFTYQNEYLGVNERLVITPLTDRCYITLAQAIGMYLGGAPAGPAGTGKTETVKDLGKTLGMYVVVFNCSDQMDYKGLGKIYRGIAQTGSFGDFDEFNRIDLPVLSVSAQQIQCVLSAVKERKKTFLYTDGCVITLIPSCGIFITMNPGYAGRQELPENLKALFRSVAMMVPDREIIIRVKLASAGFMKSSMLAKKFFILYQLCEEQLSKQRHYDFGLRNILSVLRICGSRRRSNPDLSEENILLRVLTDMNRSKLVDEDAPLFMSLTEDLFPGLRVEDNSYPDLDAALSVVCGELFLQQHPDWLKAVVQFYETHLVRHGIMLLGPPLSGKSQSILSLAKAMSAMNPSTTFPKKYTVIKMNPKAITAPQMFGRLDAATGDWTDGIFSSIWRRCTKREGEWFFFCLNGPVDAVWIENLNTVLDDNKTLTLANSDRIPMSNTLKLVFEVDSLANASPATVSRAGMIYMSHWILGWRPVLESWVASWPEATSSVIKRMFTDANFLDDLYALIDTAVLHPVTTLPRLQLFRSLMMVLTSLIYFGSGVDGLSESELIEVNESIVNALSTASHITSEGFTNATQAQTQSIATNAAAFASKYPETHLKRMVTFAVMWSFGAVLDLEERTKTFQKFLYDKKAVLDLPTLDASNPNDNVFNYFVDDTGNWRLWAEVVPKCEYPPKTETPFANILIPTIDNTSLDMVLRKVSYSQFNIMLIGESGSGKTVDILTFLNNQDKEKYAIRNINFSSATTAHLLQDNVEAFVEKRMGLSYGPVAGKKGLVFIDEVNIPQINEWGDQPTNELTRQLIEERGFYALDKPGEFHIMQDMTFLAAAPLPGGGRNDIPTRLKGHFITINVGLPASDQLDMIFGTIVKGHYQESREFSEDVCNIAARLVMTTRKLWQATKARMLPTPAKFHYIFNLRDLSRITQGFINSQPDVIDSARKLVYLWANECTRVLPDKFTTLEDITWFNNAIVQFAAEDLGDALAAEVEVFAAQNNIITVPQFAKDEEGNEKRIYFVDFMRDPPEDVPEGADDDAYEAPKIYEPVMDREVLLERIRGFQQKYNELNRRSPLDLVFFDACVAHILRISRIIRMPRGHCLLVGVGGSGKQSCTKLASSIAGYTTFQITITRGYNISNFDEDLRTLYRMAGVENKGVTFMFTDADVKEEVFLERINNILTSGEIPALFAKDEVENITNDCRPGFKKEKPREPDTNENLWNFFLDRVKANLHVVLCFSPVGPKFRERARKFPGLISGCTTDWFQPWPRQALCDVAIKNLTGFEIRTKEGDSDVLGKLVEHIAQVHLSMTDVTKSYFDRFRRQTYVTPKSYLSFLSSFKSLYLEKLVDLKEQHRRLKTGLDKLETAAADVSKMRVDLEAKEKDLAVAQTKANEMMKVISVSTAEAEKTKKEVQTVADELAVQADEIAKQKAEAEEGLAKALPALEKAEKALEAIEPNDINTLKKLAKPPHLIQRIMDTVLLLMNMPLDRVTPDPEFPIDKKILKPSWKNSLLLMNQAGFLRSLLEFERDGITDETCELLEAYLEMSDFNIEAARKSSGNAAGLLQWSQAMYEYHFIALEVEPKRAAVREAESNFKAAMASLTSAKEDLAEKQAALNKLQEQYDEAVNEKKRLQDEADLTGRRLHAASALINGLSGERKRWSQQARELDDAAVRLVGDASLSSAFLSYAGPFNQEYRQFLVTQIWLKDLEERRLPFTRGIENEIHNFLVSEATVGEWRLQGLPTDQLSTENGIIVTTSTRYPLMIDPQTQAAAWIKNMYSDLKVTTFSNKYFRQMVEDALNMGQPLLIEDVEEELDPLLDPILEKQFVKTGKSLKVKLGDKECEVCDGFKLFITSKLPNPRYLPETYAKTSVIDFSVTFSGLEAQLLARTVNIERKELEDQRRELLEEVNANKKQMAKLEEDLLSRLSATQGNLLDDVELVDVLNKTKETTEGVKEKLASAVETERKINEAREEFMVVATRGSIIYFLVTEMSTVNSMYQTSLKQFLELFDQSIYDAEPSPITTKRIANVIQNMTIKIFRYIARGLYERDKLLFILQLCLKIDLKAGNVSQLEFGTFIRGGAALDLSNVRAKPAAWIPDKAWLNIIALSALNIFTSLPNQIAENEHAWRQWYDSEAPENIDLPPEYNGRISVFQKLLLVRCLREDRTMLAVNEYIIHSLGAEFAEPVPVNFEDIFMNEAKQQVPITFLLSLGSDPTSQIEAVAKKLKIEMRFISMGQGQEPQARRLIIEGVANGTWVMISNSHLGLKFMSEIELMIMDLTEKMASVTESSGKDDGAGDAVIEAGADKGGDSAENQGTGGIFSMLGKGQLPHANFRLILTTDPHPQFPIGLLQKTLKLTNDPASGCRASLKRTYQTLTQDYLETCDKPQWLPLVYCIAFIHTTLIERKKFGSLGWCIPYEFSLPDFTASVQFLQNYLYGLDSVVKGAAQKGSLISYSTIRYMIAEVHYGGRVTDDFDRRLLKTYCEEWLSARSLTPEFEFSRGYHIPKHNNITEARTYIDGLPFVDKPQIYGLHSNADILFRNKQAGEILSTIVNMQPKDSGGGGGSKDGKQQVVLTREEQVLKLARDMLTKLPPDYDTKVTVKQQIQKQGGKAKPLNVFLGQEIDRMQVVLSLIRTTLADLQLAIAGTIIMNEALQDSLDSLYDARVPSRWLNVSWPASTLGFWLSDVTNRCTQFTDWLTKGRPNSYWLSGYFNPQGFLTSVKQEITRMHTGWALDRVYPRTNVSKFSEKGQVNQPPEEGVYIHGLFLDAAAWDKKNNRLIDQPPKVLFVPLPLLHLDATNDVYTYPTKMYDCPLYKTPARTGLNYIFTIKLPTDANPNKWVLRGTALLCNIQ